MKLYGFWRSLASYRVRVALALKGMHAEEISIDLLKGRQNTDEYLAVNPQGVVPALMLDEGGAPLVPVARHPRVPGRDPRPSRRCCRRTRAAVRACAAWR